ncbi:MAG: hypothetical protein ACAI35_12990 [Candidatus Methylacidiphilales bacterium]
MDTTAFIRSGSVYFLAAFSMLLGAASPLPAQNPGPLDKKETIEPLSIREGHFVNNSGKPVRFWGVNLVAFYPTEEQANALANRLAECQVNLVRPHHLLRPGLDWNPGMVSGALLMYQGNSRHFDPAALERFDTLCGALRKRGIYLAFSTHFSRYFYPGDVEILNTDGEDQKAWMAGVEELNGWNWKKAIDVRKSLPVIDERAALLTEEFAGTLLKHVNPHTGIAYGQDPQVLTIEILNESSIEYAIICGNRFPDYFQKKLEARWNGYCTAKGLPVCDLYKLPDSKMKEVRAEFLGSLDEAYFKRMKALIASTGSKVPVTYSNLWRGDSTAAMHARNADWIENHGYINPRVVDKLDDGLHEINRNALAGKPFFVGELNQSEGNEKIEKEKPFRTMLPAASVAYGLLQGWDGLVWFSWMHGGTKINADGTPKELNRDAHLGEMMSDQMMQDHLRSLGHVFRQGLIKPSAAPVTLWTEHPYYAGDYNGLMRGKLNPKPGWLSVHGIRRAYGPVPAAQADAPWMKESPKSPLVSDTGEIVKDLDRKQLTVTAPEVEIISGQLDDRAPQGPQHLDVSGAGNFVTLVLTSLDGKPLPESRHLLISRTIIDKDLKETSEISISVKGLAESTGWTFTATRSRGEPAAASQPTPLGEPAAGKYALPVGEWTEAEIRLP